MKTMKNVLMILLGAALVLSLAGVGAVAADTILDTSGQTGSFHVLYTVSDGYSVTIPTDVTIPTTDGGSATSNIVLDATLSEDQTLNVTVRSDNGWKMCLVTNDAAPYLYDYAKNVTYTVEGVDVMPDGSYMVISVTGAEAAALKTKSLNFVKGDARNATVAGDYADKLTFELSVTGGN